MLVLVPTLELVFGIGWRFIFVVVVSAVVRAMSVSRFTLKLRWH